MPELEENFLQVLRDYTAGDPMQEGGRWTDLPPQGIGGRLAEAGTPGSRPVVKELLHLHPYVPRKAQKACTLGQQPDRDAQFEYIAQLKQT